MKIKGTYGVGKNRGEVIELTPAEKVTIALKEAVAEHFDGYRTSVKELKLGPMSTAPQGDPLRKKWSNNSYTASGEALVTRHRLSDGAVLQDKKVDFTIRVRDALSSNGLPDLKLDELKLS